MGSRGSRRAVMLVAVMLLAAHTARADLTFAELDCIVAAAKTGLGKGIAAGAAIPNCGPDGPEVWVNPMPKEYDGKTVLAAHPNSSCYMVIYAGSFDPSTAYPGYEVADWCSPKGLAKAYYQGLHEGFHFSCPEVEDLAGCEEMGAQVSAVQAACDTVSDLRDCLCSGLACESLLTDFPDLASDDGSGGIDPDKIKAFGASLCHDLNDELRELGLKETPGLPFDPAAARTYLLVCACIWPAQNDVPASCTIPEPPDSGCDNPNPDFPSPWESEHWPVGESPGCDGDTMLEDCP